MSVTELRQETKSPASLGCHKNTLAPAPPTVMERKTTKKAESVRQSREYGVVGEAVGVQGGGWAPRSRKFTKEDN